jgi:hypothetical protein
MQNFEITAFHHDPLESGGDGARVSPQSINGIHSVFLCKKHRAAGQKARKAGIDLETLMKR